MKNYLSGDLFVSTKQFLRKMRATFFLFILCISQLFATNSLSQVAKVNISISNSTVIQVLRTIESQTDYLFVYDKNEIDLTRAVNIESGVKPVTEILSEMFSNTDVRYAMNGTNIMLLVGHSGITQQKKGISGVVTDNAGNAMPGVTVVIKGTNMGVLTDAQGNYSFANVQNEGSLIFSFVGMKPQEVAIAGKTKIDVVLQEDVIGLEEVVAVGYGTMKKKDLTGSVANVNDSRLLDKPVMNTGQALANKISGVQVVQMGGGIPGGNPMIRIRGTNSISTNGDPLFVVDGIVGVANPLSNLNPSEIESMDILKDASATAIYGARGANGVVIITTKRGRAGKTLIEYRGNATYSFMERHLYSMTAEQMMYTYEQAMANAEKYGTPNRAKDFRGPYASGLSYSEMPWLFKQDSNYPVKLLGKDGKYYAPIYNTNWESKAFRPSLSHDHFIDIRGGNENTKFYVGGGYTDQQGLMIDSYFKRFNARLSGDIVLTKWLNMSANLEFIGSKASNDNSITRSTAEVWPIVPVKYPDDPALGAYANRWGTNADFAVGEQWYNIIFRRDQEYGIIYKAQVLGSIVLNAAITKDLSFKTNVSTDFNNYKENFWSGTYFTNTNNARITHNDSFYWQNENYFNYSKSIGDHSINGMLGFSWSKYAYENVYARNNAFFTDFYVWHNLAAGSAAKPEVTSGDGNNTLNSYFGRLNYSYKGRYMLTGTARIDGSSKFGANSKYGFFPSAGVGWRLSEENFMKSVPHLSNMKLRGSWGKTGNQEIGSYVTQQFVGVNSSIVMGGKTITGIYPNSVGNPDLKWETTRQWDAGIDIGLFHDRIQLILDYYNKKTTDMLLDVPLPYSTTVGTAKLNYGSVGNRGFEITLNTRNIDKGDFQWSTAFTLSSNHNEVLALGPTGAPIYQQTGAGNATTVIRIGAPIGSFFGLNRIGTWKTTEAVEAARYGMLPGDLRFEDRNNDGKIELLSDGDIIGRAFPRIIAGFNNSFKYKNFDASIDIAIVSGVNKAFIHESAEDRQLVSGGLNSSLQAWRPDSQNSVVAQFRPGNGGGYYQSYADTHMISDASFIRGSNATLGYTFPSRFLGLEKLRVYLNTTNFFLITKCEGYDPEGSSLDKNLTLAPNSDKYQYPTPTTVSFGVNVSF